MFDTAAFWYQSHMHVALVCIYRNTVQTIYCCC